MCTVCCPHTHTQVVELSELPPEGATYDDTYDLDNEYDNEDIITDTNPHNNNTNTHNNTQGNDHLGEPDMDPFTQGAGDGDGEGGFGDMGVGVGVTPAHGRGNRVSGSQRTTPGSLGMRTPLQDALDAGKRDYEEEEREYDLDGEAEPDSPQAAAGDADAHMLDAAATGVAAEPADGEWGSPAGDADTDMLSPRAHTTTTTNRAEPVAVATEEEVLVGEMADVALDVLAGDDGAPVSSEGRVRKVARTERGKVGRGGGGPGGGVSDHDNNDDTHTLSQGASDDLAQGPDQLVHGSEGPVGDGEEAAVGGEGGVQSEGEGGECDPEEEEADDPRYIL